MKFLMKELPGQVSVTEIGVPVFVPTLGAISRHVVSKDIYPASV